MTKMDKKIKSIEIKKSLLKECNPYTNLIHVGRAMGIVTEELGFYSDKELSKLKDEILVSKDT